MSTELSPNQQTVRVLGDESETLAFGSVLGQRFQAGDTVYLSGQLGAGKTTLTRGFLQGLGFLGDVTSPTFTLIEPYRLKDFSVYHFDLYRLESAEELESIGARDYFNDQNICIVEWPEKAQTLLPAPSLHIECLHYGEGRSMKISHCSALQRFANLFS